MINDLDNVDFVPTNVKSSHQEALLYVFEDNEAVIKMIIKGKKPDNEDMFPEPTELLLIGCSIELILTQRSKSNTMTPKTNSQTDEWNPFFVVCLPPAISVLQSSDVEKNAKKIEVKKESQQSRNR